MDTRGRPVRHETRRSVATELVRADGRQRWFPIADRGGAVHDGSQATAGSVVLVASPAPALRSRCSAGLRGFAVHEVDRGAALELSMSQVKPAVVFLDLTLPGMGGLGGVPAIQRLHPAAKVIVLADAPDERQAVFALVAGARGYCDRNISSSLIRKAHEVVQRGEVWIPRSVVPLLLKRLTSAADGQPDRSSDPLAPPVCAFGTLAPRERQIAQLVGGGWSNKEIATRLKISEATVKAHLTSVFRKLNVPDRLRLALFVTGQKTSRS